MTLADLSRRLVQVDDAKTRWKLVWEFLEEYRWEPDGVQRRYCGTNRQPLAMSDGMRFWQRWRSIWLHSTIRPRRNGPRYACFSGRGSPRNWRPSGPTRWSGHRRHFASTAFTCPLGTWRPRDRAG